MYPVFKVPFVSSMQACVIAFTSEFIPREVYKYAAGEGKLDGYLYSSLAYFNTSNFEVIDGETSGPNPTKYPTNSDKYPTEDMDDPFFNKTVDICR